MEQTATFTSSLDPFGRWSFLVTVIRLRPLLVSISFIVWLSVVTLYLS